MAARWQALFTSRDSPSYTRKRLSASRSPQAWCVGAEMSRAGHVMAWESHIIAWEREGGVIPAARPPRCRQKDPMECLK